MNIHSVPCLMSILASDCAGKPIQRLWINNLMPSVWDTGAFTSATLCARGEEPRPFPTTSDPGWVDADLRFEAECRKSGEVAGRRVAVNLHLHDSWGGLWTDVSVICPPDIFAALDFDRMGHGLGEREEPECGGCPDEHVVVIDCIIGGGGFEVMEVMMKKEKMQNGIDKELHQRVSLRAWETLQAEQGVRLRDIKVSRACMSGKPVKVVAREYGIAERDVLLTVQRVDRSFGRYACRHYQAALRAEVG